MKKIIPESLELPHNLLQQYIFRMNCFPTSLATIYLVDKVGYWSFIPIILAAKSSPHYSLLVLRFEKLHRSVSYPSDPISRTFSRSSSSSRGRRRGNYFLFVVNATRRQDVSLVAGIYPRSDFRRKDAEHSRLLNKHID